MLEQEQQGQSPLPWSGSARTLRSRLVVAVIGGPSGSGLAEPEALQRLAHSLGIDDVVRFEPPSTGKDRLRDWYRAASVVAVPSHNESFGLVALEAQACGTPVVATDVGGLRTAVRDGLSGLLVPGHDPADWSSALTKAVELREVLRPGALAHAAQFSWSTTADGLLSTYRDAIADRTELLVANAR
jgi:D-inositol-3-phosphate glycosyltransferase